MSGALEAYAHRFTPGAPGAPVLALLHGTGGDKDGFDAFGAQIAPAAGRLALDGDVDEFGMKRFFRRLGEGRYDMADLALRTSRLAAFLSAAAEAYGFESGLATGVGYSNGANILANLALTGQSPLRRLALMHPLIPFDATPPPLAGLSVLITAGKRDPICPPPLTERLAATLADAGAAVRTVWTEGGHEVSAAEVAQVGAFLRD